jgi:cyclic pyranopterin phosphate synthase
MVLTDKCGRPLLNLRIALTQRCNLQCDYCHKEGEENHSETKLNEMTVSEIERIAETAVKLGITRIKLTGGEPLMREDICEISMAISAIPDLKDLSMTTNGQLLEGVANKLHDCGLRRVNISLPTLDPEKYMRLTGGEISRTLKGIKAAVKAGFCPVKLNMVILSESNVDDVPDMMEFACENGVILQLIELDPMNVSSKYYSQFHKSLDEYETMLGQKAVTIETRRYMHGRRIYRLPDVTVEVVHPIENSEFCMHCTRMRVTSDGKLKPCLMKNENLINIVGPIRQGATDAQLMELFIRANEKREPYNRNF